MRPGSATIRPWRFNRRKSEAERKAKADAEATARRAANAQVLADAERLIAARNERQAWRMPLLFAPTIGAPGAREPASFPMGLLPCLPHHAGHLICARLVATVVPLVPASCTVCRSCGPLSKTSIADEMRVEQHTTSLGRIVVHSRFRGERSDWSRLAGARQQPSHDLLERIAPKFLVRIAPTAMESVSLYRLFGECRSLFFGLSLFLWKRHPFTNDFSTGLVVIHVRGSLAHPSASERHRRPRYVCWASDSAPM
jgi:hypothetical protein